MMKKIILILIFLLPLSLQAKLKKIAIIGGGMGGVSTLSFLKKSNLEIHLFEKEKRLGGHARTVPLPGKDNKIVNVDIGPQYLAKGGWDLYFDLLKQFKLYDVNNYYNFKSDITIYHDGQKYPEFTNDQPAKINLDWLMNKDNALSRLMTLGKFMSEAYKFNQNNNNNISLGKVLDKTNIKKEYLENIIKPLVATALTSPRNRVDEVSMISTAGVLGFRRALATPTWMVPKDGMQIYIEKLADLSQKINPNINIHLSSPVKKVTKQVDGKFLLIYGNGKQMIFDQVVFAVHVPVLKEILSDWEVFKYLWERFPYTYNKVLIINDPDYLHPVYQSFYNVKIQNNGTCSMGMKLAKISKDFGNMVKTWGFSDIEYKSLKEKGSILAEADFMHPLPTTGFIDALKELRHLEKEEGNIFFAGGWSQNWETQYNAIQSGFNAARAIDPSVSNF